MITSKQKKTSLCLIFLLLASQVSARTKIYQEKKDYFRSFGDQTMTYLPVTAALGSLIIGDLKGFGQLAVSTLSSQITVEILKKSIDRERPDHGGSHQSFPSGHTAAAFSGAAYLNHRYGYQWGIPAYSLAALVAGSRVHAQKHHLDDVISAASISIFQSLLWTTPYDPQSSEFFIYPMFSSNSFSIEFLKNFGNKSLQKKLKASQKQNFNMQYNLITGGRQFNSHKLSSDKASTVPLNHIPDARKVAVFAAPQFIFSMTDSLHYQTTFIPFENRYDGTNDRNFSFQGQSYQKGERIVQAIKDYQFEHLLYYSFFPDSRWIVNAGLGFTAAYTEIRMDNYEGSKYTSHESFNFWPEVMLDLGRYLTNDLSIKLSGVGGFKDRYLWRAEASIGYNLTARWVAKLAYGLERQNRNIMSSDNTSYQHKTSAQYGTFSLGYRF